MHRSLARYSAPVSFVHAPFWATSSSLWSDLSFRYTQRPKSAKLGYPLGFIRSPRRPEQAASRHVKAERLGSLEVITSSNLVGYMTGSSEGLSPLSILPA